MQLIQQQQPQFFLSQEMLQALKVLQMHSLELMHWVEEQIEANPLLELLPGKSTFSLELGEWSASPTLSEVLLTQARCYFVRAHDLSLAEYLIGHLNERGFLDVSLEELPADVPLRAWEEILEGIQSFDPPGVGARSVQEALLIQLKRVGREHALAYRLLRDHYHDVLHYRLAMLARSLKLPVYVLKEVIHGEIARLDPCPARAYLIPLKQPIVCDLFFHHNGKGWEISVNQEMFPQWQLLPICKELDPRELAACRPFLHKASWLQRILSRRAQFLLHIGALLLREQRDFFDDGTLRPLSIKDAARWLGVHTSTLSRGIAHKYASVEGHLMALHEFFPRSIGEGNTPGDVKQHLLQLVAEENKNAPLSDEALSTALEQSGFSCARRTVAKYRAQLAIGSVRRRRFTNRLK